MPASQLTWECRERTRRFATASECPRRCQAFLDLASGGASLVDLVIAGDSLVKANDLDPALFVVGAAAYQGRNARRARRAASLVRAGVDSPMETRIRLLIVLAGLPEPQVNFIVRHAVASGVGDSTSAIRNTN